MIITASSLVALCVVNTIAIVFLGATGFGNAIVFHVFYYGCKMMDSIFETDFCPGDLIFSVYCITIVIFGIFPCQLYYLGSSMKEGGLLNLCLILPQQFGVVMGQWLLFNVDAILLGRLLGGFFYLVGLQMLWNEIATYLSETSDTTIPQQVTDKQPSSFRLDSIAKVFIVLFVGLSSGVFSGLFATGGPPLIWFYSYAQLEPSEIRSATAIIYLAEAICRILYMTLYQKVAFSVGGGKGAVYLLVGSLIGVSVVAYIGGNQIAGYINKQTSRKIMLALLIYGSVVIFVEGMKPMEAVLSAAYSVILVGLEFLVCYTMHSRPLSHLPRSAACVSMDQAIITKNYLHNDDDDDDEIEIELASAMPLLIPTATGRWPRYT